jgi:hypothetical protein
VKDKRQLIDVSLSFFFKDSDQRLILTDRTVAIYMKNRIASLDAKDNLSMIPKL